VVTAACILQIAGELGAHKAAASAAIRIDLELDHLPNAHIEGTKHMGVRVTELQLHQAGALDGFCVGYGADDLRFGQLAGRSRGDGE